MTPSNLRIASFFAGIGGLELGLERATGGRTVFQCEFDPYATSILKRHWPGVPRHDDIRTLTVDSIPQADIWCGGFPCQDISLAGKGAGIHEGARSSLWWEWHRLIRLARPRFLVVENVAAFAGRGLGDVLIALAEAGYDAEWDTVGAWEVGAPHRRDRVFVIAYLADASIGRCGGAEGGEVEQPWRAETVGASDVADPERLRQLQPQGRKRDERGWLGDGGEYVADAMQPRLPLGDERGAAGEAGRGTPERRESGRGDAAQEWTWAVEPNVGRVAHGVPKRVDRLRCLGNAVVPQVAKVVGRRLMELVAASAAGIT